MIATHHPIPILHGFIEPDVSVVVPIHAERFGRRPSSQVCTSDDFGEGGAKVLGESLCLPASTSREV